MTAPGSGWHHVAFTYDGATAFVRGYVDGTQQMAAQVPFVLEARGTPLLLGVDGALANPYRGALDNLRIYGRALGAAEIATDMNTPIGGGPAPPAISGFTPASGPIGTSVSISGSGLAGATMVRFGTTDQPIFTVVDAGTITATVPAGAVTGPVQVVTPAGTATSATTFTVSSVASVLSIDSVTVAEGGTATFTVSLSPSSTQTVTVGYATSAGSAAAGSDFTTTSGTLTFSPGVTSQPVVVGVLADSLDEPDETFSVTLSGPANATLGVATGTATIVDDDPAPTLSVADVTVTEGNSGSVSATFAITLSAPSGREVTVGYQTADGTAVAGTDYTAASGTLTFAPGVTTRSVPVAVLGDTQQEGTEAFTVSLVNPIAATVLRGTATATILDDDASSALAIGNASVTEGNSGAVNATFTVTLSPASSQTVTVGYSTADGTATAGSDYSATSGTLTFDPGVTSRTLTVPVIGDARDEADESYVVTLSAPSNAVLGNAVGTGTIVDDDPLPSMVIGNATVTEGSSGTVNATFTVTLSAPSGRAVTVSYATADGTATAGADYVSAVGTLTFPPGTTTQAIIVQVIGDVIDENNETFVVNLTTPVNATMADSSGQGTINDDDARPSLRVNDVSVTEGASGSVDTVFTVTLSAPSGLTVTVNAATANGTAVAGSDYTSAATTLTFPPGVTSRTFTVSVLGDVLDEANETFTLRLSSAVNASIADSSGLGTILDDDPVPTLAIDDVTVTEGTATVTFTVSMSAVSGRTVSVRYATANGSATSSSDYTATSGTLTFAPGTTRATITVSILDGSIRETTETFSMRLSQASNATIADGTGLCTIFDND